MPEFYTIFARIFSLRILGQMSEFYTKFARKIFVPEFWGQMPPSPTTVSYVYMGLAEVSAYCFASYLRNRR